MKTVKDDYEERIEFWTEELVRFLQILSDMENNYTSPINGPISYNDYCERHRDIESVLGHIHMARNYLHDYSDRLGQLDAK